MKIAFIVSKFPCYDEAYILREIYALSKKLDLFIFSLRRSKDPIVQDESDERRSRTVYVPYLFSLKVFEAHILTVLSHPIRYFRALARLILGNRRSFEFLIKSLAFF